MKKFVAVISILLLLFCHFSAISEEIDLESLNDEELSELSNRIRQEMSDRGIVFEEDFPFGKYIVGQDIRAGIYTLKFVNVIPNNKPHVIIYESAENAPDGMIFDQTVYWDCDVQITLKDGMLLYIKSGQADVMITNKKSSFAP